MNNMSVCIRFDNNNVMKRQVMAYLIEEQFMKLSSSFFITRRENPKDEHILASKLLIKSGMVLKNDK